MPIIRFFRSITGQISLVLGPSHNHELVVLHRIRPPSAQFTASPGLRRPSTTTLSPIGWTLLYRIREEIEALPVFLSFYHGFYNAGARDHYHNITARFFQELFSDLRGLTSRSRRTPVSQVFAAHRIVERMTRALVLLQREPIRTMRDRCLICDSPTTAARSYHIPNAVSVSLSHITSYGRWVLNEINIFPHWGDVDSTPLCMDHNDQFIRCLCQFILSQRY